MLTILIGLTQQYDKLVFVDYRALYVFTVGEAFSLSRTRCVFA